MVQRQVPRPAELLELMKFKKIDLDGKRRRLSSAQTIEDLRKIAKRRTPAAAFDYTDGAAEREISMHRSVEAFEDIEFHPAILNDVSSVDTTTQILGGSSALPFAIAPTGFTRLMQTEGEVAGATAAGEAGIPFTLSTLGTTSIEDVRAANPYGRNWFQLYVMRQREISYGLVERAAAAGFDTLFFTVDTPVAGARLRDCPQRLLDPAAAEPRHRDERDPAALVVVGLPDHREARVRLAVLRPAGPSASCSNSAMDPTIDFEDLAEIRKMWPGRFAVKGVQTLEDAKKLADLGVDAIVLSNHGGRQLDRAPVPFHLLPEVAREVGKDVEIILDTGIRSGADIVASIALGADFTMIGRAYLYGLMAGGKEGVDRTLQILAEPGRADHEAAAGAHPRRPRPAARHAAQPPRPARAGGAPLPPLTGRSRPVRRAPPVYIGGAES
jgi:L-lactate dehydrogenase (cytochrome)